MHSILIYGPPRSGKKSKALSMIERPDTAIYVDCAIHPLFQFDQYDDNKIFIVEHVDMLQNHNQLLHILDHHQFIFTARRIKPILNLAKQCKIIFTMSDISPYPPQFETMLNQIKTDDMISLKYLHNSYFLYGLGVDERWIYEYQKYKLVHV